MLAHNCRTLRPLYHRQAVRTMVSSESRVLWLVHYRGTVCA
ncbi:hypothetical protein M3J09_013453 [Ascochyta lentis]